MRVDNDDPRPAYAQVAEGLREMIRSGKLRAGDRLPPGRELCEEFGVAMMTVRKAIDVLRQDGAVASQQGRGVFVTTAGVGEPTDDLETLRTAVEKLTERVAALEAAISRSAD